MKAIALVYQVPKNGPQIVGIFPDGNLDELTKEEILSSSQQVEEEETSAEYIVPGSLGLINIFFTIPSRWSMENCEKVVISLLFQKGCDLDAGIQELRPRLSNLIYQLKNGEDIFKAFYANYVYSFPEEERPKIREKNAEIREMLENFYSSVVIENYHQE
ncbi:MAG TPA: hypothetical protein VKK79_12095 [Candidatus Lokiarchaeia archaeon]|nr:hypothetical protein [Candidatus Lokiarchaeia archaeon]